MLNIPDNMERYFETPVDCPVYDRENPDYRCSILYDKTDYRKKKAESESKKNKHVVDDVTKYGMEFFEKMGIESVVCIKQEDGDLEKATTNNLVLKFTNDGYLGVIATGSIPTLNSIDFDDTSSSSQLIFHVKKKWDKNASRIFTLPNISKDESILLKKGLGNYLIEEKGVAIIDHYSHNWGSND